MSALTGLIGAIETHGKTANTDSLVLRALQRLYSEDDGIAAEAAEEKHTLAPNCESCLNPCGNTSDYDMRKFHEGKELFSLKEELMEEACALAKRTRRTHLPDVLCRAVSYFRYDLSPESYRELIEEIKNTEA